MPYFLPGNCQAASLLSRTQDGIGASELGYPVFMRVESEWKNGFLVVKRTPTGNLL